MQGTDRRALKSRVKRALVVAGDVTRVPATCLRLQSEGGAPLRVVLCWDVEPDGRMVERVGAGRWMGFEGVVPLIERMRERVASFTGAPAAFSWFLRMDPQVADTWGSTDWVAERYASELAALESRGDQLGLHTHTWRWQKRVGWVRDHDPAWEEHCAEVALQAFETAYGRPCEAHRGGDRVLSAGMLRRLTAGGVSVDLTVEPDKPPAGPLAKHELATGHTPDYRGVPRAPYRSTPDAFPAADPSSGSDPLLIPLATGPRSKYRRAKPLQAHVVPGLFAVRLLRATRTLSRPVLAFAMRTDPHTIRAWEGVTRNLEHLARIPGTRFVTAGEAARSTTV